MGTTVPHPLRRQRNLLLVALLILAAAAWVILVAQASVADESMTGLTMGMGPPLFLAIWIVRLVA